MAPLLHVLVAWTPAGRSKKEIQEIRDFSDPRKNPFDRDPRTEAQREAYRKKELARRHWLEDRRQWEKYRRAGIGPKTFETFRKHKLAGAEVYKLWKLNYRRQNALLQNPDLALPGASSATADEAKFTKYFFNPENPNGCKKGDAFSSRLGYNASNWEKMRSEILEAAKKYPATFKAETQYERKYERLVILQGLKHKPANVLIGWEVRADGTVRMTTAHMEKVR